MPESRRYWSHEVVVTFRGMRIELAPDSFVVAFRVGDDQRVRNGLRVILHDRTGIVEVPVLAGSDSERELVRGGTSGVTGPFVIEHRDGHLLATGGRARVTGVAGGEPVVCKIDMAELAFAGEA